MKFFAKSFFSQLFFSSCFLLSLPLYADTYFAPQVHGDWQMPKSQFDPINMIKTNIFKNDERRLLTNSEKNKFKMIGIIKSPKTGIGTAVLITTKYKDPYRSYDLVLTTAHVFYDKNCNLRDNINNFYFEPQNSFLGRIPIKHIVTGNKCALTSDWENDWAVAVLDEKISHYTGSLGIWRGTDANVYNNYPQALVGYNYKIKALTIQKNCRGFNSPNSLSKYKILHNCSITRGYSGSPLLALYKGQYYVYGINSSELYSSYYSGNEFNIYYYYNGAVKLTGAFGAAILKLSKSDQE